MAFYYIMLVANIYFIYPLDTPGDPYCVQESNDRAKNIPRESRMSTRKLLMSTHKAETLSIVGTYLTLV